MIRSLLSIIFPAAAILAQNTPTPAPQQPVALEAKLQEMIFNNGTEPQSLDPALMQGTPEFRIRMALFEGLVVPNPQTAKAEPGLAESWTISTDMRTYTFKLRKALWSDGTPITAQDVVDSWLRTLDPATKAEYSHMSADVIVGAKAFNRREGPRNEVKVRALDPQTFEVTFVSPMPHTIDMLTQTCFDVFPMHAIKKYGKDWTKPGNFVGNGPFVLQDWNPQYRLIVIKNKNYWDASNVKLDRITFLPIEERADSYDKFRAGEIDWLPDVDPARMGEVKLRKDYQHSVGSTIYYYVFNVIRKPFTDVRVRKALAMAINRQELCDKVLLSDDMPTGGFVPPMGHFVTTQGNTYNPDEAKKLLAEAGFPGGKGFPKIKVIYNTSTRHKKIAEWVKEQWKSVLGIEIKVDNVEWSRFLDLRVQHDFDVARAGWQADYADPANYLDVLFRSGNHSNDGVYTNKDFEALLDRANELPLGEARDKVLMQAEEILITRDQAAIPFFFYTNQNLIDLDKWGGWYENSMNLHPWKAIYRK